MPAEKTTALKAPTRLPEDTVNLLKLHAIYTSVTACNATGWNCGPRCSGPTAGTQFLGEVYDAETSVYGYVAAHPGYQRIFVAFRGSTNVASWMQNLDFTKVPLNLPGDGGARVHRGFAECFDAVKDRLRPLVLAAVKQFPGYTVTYTGYSLGAAVTILAAANFRSQLANVPQQLFTYGEPRIGDNKFARFTSNLFPASNNIADQPLRVVNYNDIVPRLPPSWTGYQHRDREVWITSESDTGAVLCDANLGKEDPNCAWSVSGSLDTTRHRWYWGIRLGGGDDCRAAAPSFMARLAPATEQPFPYNRTLMVNPNA